MTGPSELGVADGVSFVQGDAGAYEAAAGAFDIASCLGATWIGGGLIGTAALLKPAVRAGGLVLIGEPFWLETPPAEAVAAFGFAPGDYVSLAGTADRLEAAGLELVEMVLADGDSWDRYEAAQWRTISVVAGSEPGRSRPRGDAPVPGREPPDLPAVGQALPGLGRVRHAAALREIGRRQLARRPLVRWCPGQLPGAR